MDGRARPQASYVSERPQEPRSDFFDLGVFRMYLAFQHHHPNLASSIRHIGNTISFGTASLMVERASDV
jgi:hypothetical protein